MTEWEWLISGWPIAYALGSVIVIIICFWIVDYLDNRNKEGD